MTVRPLRLVLLLSILAGAFATCGASSKKGGAGDEAVTWKLVFVEEFKGTRLNEKLWSRIDLGHPDWCKHMSLRDDLVTVKDGQLHCWGKRNDDLTFDSRPFLTGGVSTKGKLAMTYAKIEFKMKLDDGQRGAWPAVWMMPEKEVRGWPNDGEIDIVERLNSDDFTYQTLHYGNGSAQDLSHGGRGKIKKGDWNVYGLEWTPESIVWTVNGEETFRHDRGADDDELKFPWTKPFYLMIDMQLGGRWVGGVELSTLPVAMHVDWVKIYSGSRGGKKFTVFTRDTPEKNKRERKRR